MAQSRIPITTVKRIMKETGAERVSEKAATVLAEVLREKAEEITEDALALARHAGRKTISAEDVQLASKR